LRARSASSTLVVSLAFHWARPSSQYLLPRDPSLGQHSAAGWRPMEPKGHRTRFVPRSIDGSATSYDRGDRAQTAQLTPPRRCARSGASPS
jgi:hypothetical protein